MAQTHRDDERFTREIWWTSDNFLCYKNALVVVRSLFDMVRWILFFAFAAIAVISSGAGFALRWLMGD